MSRAHHQSVATATSPVDRAATNQAYQAYQARDLVERCKGILMGVHRIDADAAAALLERVARTHHTPEPVLALATTELVHGAVPSDANAAVLAMRFLMGRHA